jgi:hypothetical protein
MSVEVTTTLSASEITAVTAEAARTPTTHAARNSPLHPRTGRGPPATRRRVIGSRSADKQCRAGGIFECDTVTYRRIGDRTRSLKPVTPSPQRGQSAGKGSIESGTSARRAGRAVWPDPLGSVRSL